MTHPPGSPPSDPPPSNGSTGPGRHGEAYEAVQGDAATDQNPGTHCPDGDSVQPAVAQS